MPPAPYWLGRCHYNVTRSHGLPILSRVWQHLKLSEVSLGASPRYGLVVDEGVKKPTKQTNKPTQPNRKVGKRVGVGFTWSCPKTSHMLAKR